MVVISAFIGAALATAPEVDDLRVFFFFQAEDGIRDADVTGVQTCALPISAGIPEAPAGRLQAGLWWRLCGVRSIFLHRIPRSWQYCGPHHTQSTFQAYRIKPPARPGGPSPLTPAGWPRRNWRRLPWPPSSFPPPASPRAHRPDPGGKVQSRIFSLPAGTPSLQNARPYRCPFSGSRNGPSPPPARGKDGTVSPVPRKLPLPPPAVPQNDFPNPGNPVVYARIPGVRRVSGQVPRPAKSLLPLSPEHLFFHPIPVRPKGRGRYVKAGGNPFWKAIKPLLCLHLPESLSGKPPAASAWCLSPQRQKLSNWWPAAGHRS